VPRGKVTLVCRSVGGRGGALSVEQHSGLIIELAQKTLIVHGGPREGKIVGSATATANPMVDFAEAKGADWDNPSATRTLPVETIAVVEVRSLTEQEVRDIVDELNHQLERHDYTFVAGCMTCGPNSNSYVARVLRALGTPLPAPANAVGWTWTPPDEPSA
jgi:hypothetical protein